MADEFKPYVPFPQHKALRVDNGARLQFAKKYATGGELLDELVENASAMVAQQKRHPTHSETESKPAPIHTGDFDAAA